MLDKVVFLAVATLCYMRIAGYTNLSFQAVAHLVVGWLFGVYHGNKRSYYIQLALLLTVVEVLCFLSSLLDKGK